MRLRKYSTTLTDADIRLEVSRIIREVTGENKLQSQKFIRGLMRLIRKIKSETYIAGLVKGKQIPAPTEAKEMP